MRCGGGQPCLSRSIVIYTASIEGKLQIPNPRVKAFPQGFRGGQHRPYVAHGNVTESRGTGYIYRMESATAVRCAGCGYENNPYYRYCGMCGNPLRAGEPPLPMVPFQPPAFK